MLNRRLNVIDIEWLSKSALWSVVPLWNKTDQMIGDAFNGADCESSRGERRKTNCCSIIRDI